MTVAPITAVVTGASQGLGLAIAQELASRGVRVMLAAPNPDTLAKAAATIPGAAHLITDVRDPAQTQALADATIARFGQIDIWLNNAGQALTGDSLLTLPPETLDRMIDINLKGALYGCQAAARAMARTMTSGSIWNMLGAGADNQPVPKMNGYATSKAALTFLTRALAGEAPPHLAFAALSPGLVLTEGFFRENAKSQLPPEARAARDAVVNILADTPQTLATWAADIMLGVCENGSIHTWLTPEKIAARQQESPPRDVLTLARAAQNR